MSQINTNAIYDASGGSNAVLYGVASPTGGMGFAPTALLVLTHNVTGLKYFCKTTRIKNLHWYKGSGIYWKRHMRVHGRDVSAGVVGIYNDKDRCMAAALAFSEKYDIVNSDEWANLAVENGINGAGAGKLNHRYGKPHPNKGGTRPDLKGRYVGAANPMFGKPSPMRGKHNAGASAALKGRPRPIGGGKPPRPVIRLNDGVKFASVAEAALSLQGSRSGITQCCMGKAKTAHGYRWAYREAA
jgi:hypothetical protein